MQFLRASCLGQGKPLRDDGRDLALLEAGDVVAEPIDDADQIPRRGEWRQRCFGMDALASQDVWQRDAVGLHFHADFTALRCRAFFFDDLQRVGAAATVVMQNSAPMSWFQTCTGLSPSNALRPEQEPRVPEGQTPPASWATHGALVVSLIAWHNRARTVAYRATPTTEGPGPGRERVPSP